MSKGLEAFERIKKHHEIWETEDIALYGSHSYATGEYEQEEELNAVEKELKALEIIKEKRVNVLLLRYSFILEEISKDGIEYYNNHFGNEDLQLTKEEFDLLKEVLS